jgi:ribosomal protein S18 acetylase RimI-like enzyme
MIIEESRTEEQAVDVRHLASSTGMEEDEIDEMIEGDKIFLAKKEERTIGFIALRYGKSARNLKIVGLAIRESQRRRGFARLLLNHAERFAKRHKSRQLIVSTANDNIPALALYQENGFIIREVKLGSMIAHHGGKEILGWNSIPIRDEIVLEKNLTYQSIQK